MFTKTSCTNVLRWYCVVVTVRGGEAKLTEQRRATRAGYSACCCACVSRWRRHRRRRPFLRVRPSPGLRWWTGGGSGPSSGPRRHNIYASITTVLTFLLFEGVKRNRGGNGSVSFVAKGALYCYYYLCRYNIRDS